MRFSSTGGSVETTEDGGQANARSISGVSSTHFLKLVEERGQIGFWTLDFTAGDMTTSIGLYRLIGLDPLVAFRWDDLMKMVHPEDRDAQHNTQEILRSGQPINREFRIVRPDGTVRWLQNKAEVIVGAKGLPSCAVGLMMDITDQYEARISIEEGWSRYKTLVSAMASMEYRALPNGEVLLRAGWEELTGQTADEAEGLGSLNAVHPDDREATYAQWLASLATGKVFAADFRLRCVDGVYRQFLGRAAPMFNSDGTVREWVGTLVGTVSTDTLANEKVDVRQLNLQPAHIRAARALLNWTINDLAFHAEVSVSSIRRLESEDGNTVRTQVRDSVLAALEACGVSFHKGKEGEIILRFVCLEQ